MNLKKIITLILLLFVGISVVALVMQNSNKTDVIEKVQTEQATTDSSKPENRLIVYYLHGNVRCQTCEKLEAFSSKALTTNYATQLENGLIEFRVLNYDEPEHEHFLTDFNISFQSLVVVDIKGNKEIGFENLAKIWDLTHDEQAYLDYVKENIDAHIRAVL